MTDDSPAADDDLFAASDHDRFTDYLRERAEPAWTEATDHRFTEALLADTLPDEVFARYLVQDYAFVRTLASVVGHAAGQAPTLAAKAEFAAFLRTVATDEDDFFRRSFDALAVPEADREAPALHPVTARFDDLLRRAVHEGDYAETLAVLVPAEWVYLTWASRCESPPERFYLAEWVDLHRGAGFEGVVGFLRGELDDVGPTLSPHRERAVRRLFRRTVEYEVAFFDAAYEGVAAGDADGGSEARDG
ncbi:TenA family protein [Halomarina litorea]|uniref:TenA family protein n=1 Tax=Halomarina litorea TaxID=2961595 RepID=UPI0020C3C16D|nr:TenA family protein [Halomarina sp. BCD28]